MTAAFSAIYFFLTPNLLKTLQECQHYEDEIFISKVIQGHIRQIVCQNHSSAFVYWPILMKIYINAYIMKTHIFYKIIYDLKCNFYAMENFVFYFT